MKTSTWRPAFDPQDKRAKANPSSPLWDKLDNLLRDSSSLIWQILKGQDLLPLSQAMILSIAVGGGLFGAALGSYRGGLQILYAGIKLPLVLLFTAAIIAPALTSLNRALGRPADLAKDLALVLSTFARSALTLAALAPLLLLSAKWEMDYHDAILLTVATSALAGLVGLVHLGRGLWRSFHQGFAWASLVLLATTSVVGAHMAWTLRPYLVRPRTLETPFVRDLEGGFLDALGTTSRSAQGLYDRESAPLSTYPQDLNQIRRQRPAPQIKQAKPSQGVW